MPARSQTCIISCELLEAGAIVHAGRRKRHQAGRGCGRRCSSEDR